MLRPSTLFALGLFTLSLAPLAACAGKNPTVVNYDPSVDFASKNTFAWVTEDRILRNAEGAEKRIYNAENERRLREAIELELATKGMTKVERDNASTLVHFVVTTAQKQGVASEPGFGYGMTWSAKSERASYVEGTLIILLFDAKTSREIWSGSLSKGLVGGSDPQAVINEVVPKILQAFPPE